MPDKGRYDWNEYSVYVLKTIEAIEHDLEKLEKKIDGVYVGGGILVLGAIIAALVKWVFGG